MALPNEVTQIPDPMTIYQQGEKKTADLQAKQTAAEADIKARQAAETAPIQQARDTAGADLGKMLDKGPDQVALPKNEATHLDPKQLSESAGMMMALAGLAGAMIRAPITVALRGMTGAMQGAQAADEKQFNEGYTKYKDNLNEALKLNDEKLKEYDRVLKGKEFNVREMDAQLRNIAKKYGDEGIANAKDFKTMFDSVNGQTKAMADIRKHQDTIDQHVKDRQQRAELAKEKSSKGSAAGGAGVGTGDAMEVSAWKHLLLGKEPPGMGNASAAQRQAVREKSSQLGKALGLSAQEQAMLPTDNGMKVKAADSLTKWGAFVDKSAENIRLDLNNVIELAKKMDPGSIQAINKMILAGEKQFQNGDAQAYALAVNKLNTEYIRLQQGPLSNAMLHVDAQHKADALLSEGISAEGWAGPVKKIIDSEAANTKASVHSIRDSLMSEVSGAGGHAGGAKPREFKSEADAAAAGLAPGTKITIGGVSGTWH